jgi:hypothetical protein
VQALVQDLHRPKYSQWAGRHELFEQERPSGADGVLWDSCVLAYEEKRGIK